MSMSEQAVQAGQSAPQSLVRSLNLTRGEIERFQALGGGAWLRVQLETAPADDAVLSRPLSPKGLVSEADKIRTTSVRLPLALSDRLDEMGGSHWVRHRIQLATKRDA